MRKLMLFVLAATFTATLFCTPAFSQDLFSKNYNWRVYNVKPGTSSFWDINKAKAAPGGGVQFPIQQYVLTTSGSFAVYLLANYNLDMTGKTITADTSWTSGTFLTRTADLTNCSGARVRLEFQDVAAGPYDSNDYWWSVPAVSLDLNTTTSGTLSASLLDRTLWTNQAGKSATDQDAPWTDWTGVTVTTSPYDGFTKAVKSVKQVGISFGNPCAYASGIAEVGGTGTFTLSSYTIQ